MAKKKLWYVDDGFDEWTFDSRRNAVAHAVDVADDPRGTGETIHIYTGSGAPKWTKRLWGKVWLRKPKSAAKHKFDVVMRVY